MAPSALDDWASYLMSPTPFAIIVTALVVFSVPLILHLLIYRSSGTSTLPLFLIVGPSGAGKTSLLTQFERGHEAQTRTSHAPLIVECSLPITTAAASSRYRSANDPSSQAYKKFLLMDTPGHGKLRFHAINTITKPQNLKGIIFMVDAAVLSVGLANKIENEALHQAAEYLHDILLLLQKRATSSKSAKGPTNLPVLVIANKLDLFTALPAPLVRTALEAELTTIRHSKNRGLLDSGVGINDTEDEKDWLGGGGGGKFEFSQMNELDITVEVVGGSVLGADMKPCWDWLGKHL